MSNFSASVVAPLRTLREQVRRWIFRHAESWLGVHIVPVHFYSPIPDVGRLDRAIHSRINPCPGIDFDVEGQMERLAAVSARQSEYMPPVNGGLSQVDAFVLFALIRQQKPRTYIEIGAGDSTLVALEALALNAAEGVACRFISIEPYPRPFVREIRAPGFELIEKQVQDVDIATFADADILFIDSSHVAKIGSDVNFELLQIVPTLKVGALVHWHDIMIPVDYPREWIENGLTFWNESYMVHAFLLHNSSFRVVWASRYLQVLHADALRRTFSYFRPEAADQQLSSFWVQRVR